MSRILSGWSMSIVVGQAMIEPFQVRETNGCGGSRNQVPERGCLRALESDDRHVLVKFESPANSPEKQ